MSGPATLLTLSQSSIVIGSSWSIEMRRVRPACPDWSSAYSSKPMWFRVGSSSSRIDGMGQVGMSAVADYLTAPGRKARYAPAWRQTSASIVSIHAFSARLVLYRLDWHRDHEVSGSTRGSPCAHSAQLKFGPFTLDDAKAAGVTPSSLRGNRGLGWAGDSIAGAKRPRTRGTISRLCSA